MTTIAECPAPETSVPNRVIKMAVIGGSGVGKTGKKTTRPPVVVDKQFWGGLNRLSSIFRHIIVYNVVLCIFFTAALVVRFLTRRFIGDYERNAGEYLSSFIL